MADLSQLSTEDLMALKAGRIGDVSTDGLLRLRGQDTSQMQHGQSYQAKPVQQTGGILDLIRGLGSGVADLGRGAQQRYTEGKSLFDPSASADRDRLYAEEAARRERREFDPSVTQAEKVGRGVGMIGGTLPLAMLPGGQSALGSTLSSLLTGAVGGALFPTTSGKEALSNVGLGAAGQAAGNVASYALQPTISRNLTGAQKAIIDAAREERIPLRTSEATGSNVIRNWEQLRANRPITGAMEKRFNEEQTRAINRALTKKLGDNLPEVSDASLLEIRNRLGSQVSDTMKGKTVPLDTDFFNAVAKVESESNIGGRLTSSPAIRSKIEDALDLIVSKGSVSGEVAQKIRSKLADQARDARAADNTELAKGLEDIVGGLKKAMEGTLTDSERAAWTLANRRYSNYKIIEEAFRKDPKALAEGDIPINKLARVMEQERPLSYVHGTGDLAGLAKLGQVIKPPGRSALLGDNSVVGLRNAMDFAHGAAWPVVESQLMQRYLTGGLPMQRTIRDLPYGTAVQDALLRSGGFANMLGEDSFK